MLIALTAANQVLPRRKGDLWIHVSSLFFKTWERRHAVIDGAEHDRFALLCGQHAHLRVLACS